MFARPAAGQMESLMQMNLRSFFPSRRAGLLAGLAIAAVMVSAPSLRAQVTGSTTTTTDAQGQKQETVTATATLSDKKSKKQKVDKADRIQQSKDTKVAEKKEKKLDPLLTKDLQLPDKQLYDKAVAQAKSGHFDIARLDLQTLLNTYPDSQYQMRAKLAVADSWYQEGGTAALAQAEQEYSDFITFFPNVPEAAEAQMRIGDIYFKQMDVPDRDYTKGTHAEEAYRTMLKQYPDAPKEITAQAKQKLREVQELMATREAELGAFYATHNNWPASIARYQTVVDTYPQYSHMDDTLIGIGDAYEAEAKIVRAQAVCPPKPTAPCFTEGARAKLLEEYDGKAADEYRKVVLEHSAAPHVEDAKERLAAMNLPIPQPTPEQVAASEALEGSRAQYDLRKRLELIFLRRPDTVTAAQIGDPPLQDPPPTVAPTIIKNLRQDYVVAMLGGDAKSSAPLPASSADAESKPAESASPAEPATPAAAPTLSDVPAANGDASSTNTMTETTPASDSGGNHLGVEILTPGANGNPPASAPASDIPSATGKPDPNYGLTTPGAARNAPLPPVEKPADAPDQINDVEGKPQPVAQTKDPNSKKKPKSPAIDKSDESSSKKKPKKGLDKINPF
jgi:outer membrane protein assembly factor BamD